MSPSSYQRGNYRDKWRIEAQPHRSAAGSVSTSSRSSIQASWSHTSAPSSFICETW